MGLWSVLFGWPVFCCFINLRLEEDDDPDAGLDVGILLDMIGADVFSIGRLVDGIEDGLFASSCDDS